MLPRKIKSLDRSYSQKTQDLKSTLDVHNYNALSLPEQYPTRFKLKDPFLAPSKLPTAPEVVISHPKNLIIQTSPRKAAMRDGLGFTRSHHTEPPREKGKDHRATGL